ncbi:MAG TPA: sugar transferase, partial [Thermoanaerobaculia bacterium]|nr:sugar transferase [Thermoanaerobaculia bacterium]
SRYIRLRGYNYRTVLIVGTSPAALRIADSIRGHRFWGYRVLGFIRCDNGDEPREPWSGPYPLLGEVEDIPRIAESNVVDDVIFAVHRRELDRLEDLFLSLQEQGIRTRFAMDLFPHTRARIEMEELDGMPLLSFSTTPTSQIQLMAKRALDVALASLLLLLGLPVVTLIAGLIKLTSGGNVLFRQTRCGLNGRFFTLYKFRTMVEGAEDRRRELLHLNEMKGPVFKLRSDPRVTWLGRILRRFSLDELPQLWNVLRGDMSLVGPRPPIPEEVAQYQRWQRRRLAMKPGLTCLWQISGRNNIDFERWMQLDLEYIDSWSPMLDLKILLKTIPVVLSGKGAS